MKEIKLDTTLFIKKKKQKNINSSNLYNEFAKIIYAEFEMRMIGKLNYFLGLQIKQTERKFSLVNQNSWKSLWKNLDSIKQKEMQPQWTPQ